MEQSPETSERFKPTCAAAEGGAANPRLRFVVQQAAESTLGD